MREEGIESKVALKDSYDSIPCFAYVRDHTTPRNVKDNKANIQRGRISH